MWKVKCEKGNEPSGSMKCGGFIDQLSTCQLLKKTLLNGTSFKISSKSQKNVGFVQNLKFWRGLNANKPSRVIIHMEAADCLRSLNCYFNFNRKARFLLCLLALHQCVQGEAVSLNKMLLLGTEWREGRLYTRRQRDWEDTQCNSGFRGK